MSDCRAHGQGPKGWFGSEPRQSPSKSLNLRAETTICTSHVYTCLAHGRCPIRVWGIKWPAQSFYKVDTRGDRTSYKLLCSWSLVLIILIMPWIHTWFCLRHSNYIWKKDIVTISPNGDICEPQLLLSLRKHVKNDAVSSTKEIQWPLLPVTQMQWSILCVNLPGSRGVQVKHGFCVCPWGCFWMRWASRFSGKQIIPSPWDRASSNPSGSVAQEEEGGIHSFCLLPACWAGSPSACQLGFAPSAPLVLRVSSGDSD